MGRCDITILSLLECKLVFIFVFTSLLIARSRLIIFKDFSKKDSRWLKFFVAFIYCLDTAHQAMLVQFIYVYLVTEFGNLSFLLKMDRFVSPFYVKKSQS